MAEQAATYKCDVCGAVFKDPDSLTKHKAIHEAHDSDAPLEQGTDKPLLDPSVNNPTPSPGPTLPQAP